MLLLLLLLPLLLPLLFSFERGLIVERAGRKEEGCGLGVDGNGMERKWTWIVGKRKPRKFIDAWTHTQHAHIQNSSNPTHTTCNWATTSLAILAWWPSRQRKFSVGNLYLYIPFIHTEWQDMGD